MTRSITDTLRHLGAGCLIDDARMRMFERFAIGIPVFQGSASAYPVEARLKFCQVSDSLQFWYELIRPDRIFRLAVDDDLKTIKEATGFPLLYGTP